mmetsp:Transcript_8487/g.18247  ORF Transcript_8487/g.18247 Transcript_8487/m.18247 type:complete len:214 (-) Transcript_8487:633-1274(-)
MLLCLSSTEIWYSSFSPTCRNVGFLSRSTNLLMACSLTSCERISRSKERLRSRRRAAMVVASLLARGISFSTCVPTLHSRISSLFSWKMDSFLRNVTESSRSSGLFRCSIRTSTGVIPRRFILRSTDTSSARFSSTCRHTYSSLSCFFSVMRCFLASFSKSSALSSFFFFSISSRRIWSRLISSSTTRKTMSPTLYVVITWWKELKLEKAKKT